MVTDSPETILEFMERFHAEEQCEEYLLKLGFSEGFRCRACSGTKAYRTGRRLECPARGKDTSRQGISANEPARQTGIQQEDAWLLHNLRSHLGEARLLDEVVQADECVVGGVERASNGGRGAAGRCSKVKALVAVAVKRRAWRHKGKLKSSAGRGRLHKIDVASEMILTALAELAVAKGATSARTAGAATTA